MVSFVGIVSAGCSSEAGSQTVPNLLHTVVDTSRDLRSSVAHRDSTFHTILSFSGKNGAHPQGDLVTFNGKLYGTTKLGGKSRVCSAGYGAVFFVSVSGAEHTYSFNYVVGAAPAAQLTIVKLASQKTELFGTASKGGAYFDRGTAFAMQPRGSLHWIHDFGSDVDGANPLGGLTLANTLLYGTTSRGPGGGSGYGTVFPMTLAGQDTVIYTFADTNGAFPHGSLVLFHNLPYGTTSDGGTSSRKCGVVFEVRPKGGGQIIYHFSGLNGAHPYAGLALWRGKLYGTTRDGGPPAKAPFLRSIRRVTKEDYSIALVALTARIHTDGSPYGTGCSTAPHATVVGKNKVRFLNSIQRRK
jgi:hypothetical protein